MHRTDRDYPARSGSRHAENQSDRSLAGRRRAAFRLIAVTHNCLLGCKTITNHSDTRASYLARIVRHFVIQSAQHALVLLLILFPYFLGAVAQAQRGNQDAFFQRAAAAQEQRRREKSPNYVTTLLQMPEMHSRLEALAISSNAKLAAGGTGISMGTVDGKSKDEGGDVVLWNASNGKLLGVVGSHGDTVDFVNLRNRGRILISMSSKNHLIQVWDTKKKRRISRIDTGYPIANGWTIGLPTVSPNGRYIATVRLDKLTIGEQSATVGTELSVWDAKSGKLKWNLPQAHVRFMAFTPDSKRLIANTDRLEWRTSEKTDGLIGRSVERTMCAWNANDGKEMWRTDLDENYSVLVTEPGHSSTIWGLRRTGIERWDCSQGALTSTTQFKLTNNRGFRPSSAGIDSATNSLVAIDSMGRQAYLFNLATGEVAKKTSTKFPVRLANSSFANGIDMLISDMGSRIGPATVSTKQLLEQAP